MKTVLSFLWLLLGVVLPVSGFGQNSFVRNLSVPDFPPNTPIFPSGVEISGNGEMSMPLTTFTGTLIIASISPAGNASGAFSALTTPGIWRRTPTYHRSGNYHLISAFGSGSIGVPQPNDRSAVFGLNFETGTYWARQIGLNSFTSSEVYISSHEEAIFDNRVNFTQGQKLNLSLLDMATGASIWERFYQKSNQSVINAYTTYNIQEFPEGGFSILGRASHINSSKSEYLLKLAPTGFPLKGVGIESDSIEFRVHSIDAEGNVFLAGRIQTDTIEPFPGFGPFFNEGFIAKLDVDYNVLWAKQLHAEQFPCVTINIKAFPDGHVIFTYVTFGDLPVISGKISPDGDLLWYRGYEFYRPQIALGADSSIYFAAYRKYFPHESWQDGSPILAKTDPNGGIDGCPQFAACLSLVDMPLPLETWEWTQEVAPELPEIDVEVVPVNFATTPYCGTPTPPSAEFSLPDTVCQFTCLSPDSLQNRLAHYRQWRLTGPGVDTLFADSTFSWCYHVPGRYTVEQEIWLLGCSEFYSRSIEILPDNLLPPLGEDRSLCDTPYELKPLSNRPLRNFLWSDGSTGSSLNVPDSGVYSLVASDGYCSVSDTVALRFVRRELTEPPLDLGSDTTLCPVLLPYILRPQSPYSEVFFIDNSTTSAQEFALFEAGNYTISTWIEDCLFSASLQLEVEPCPVPIYLPNSFSPNDDGINDRIVPQGEDYRGIRLEVYDRWGGLRHRNTGAPFDWDGKSDGKPLGTGVYVVVFYYQNLRSLQAEHIAQDVLLIR